MPEWTSDQVNEWSLQIKQEKYDRAVRAGHGTKKECLQLRLRELDEEIKKLEGEKAAIVNKVCIAKRKYTDVIDQLEKIEQGEE